MTLTQISELLRSFKGDKRIMSEYEIDTEEGFNQTHEALEGITDGQYNLIKFLYGNNHYTWAERSDRGAYLFDILDNIGFKPRKRGEKPYCDCSDQHLSTPVDISTAKCSYCGKPPYGVYIK